MAIARPGSIAALVIVFLSPNVVQATKYWKNGVTSGNWGTVGNWSALSAAGPDNATLPFANEEVRIVHTDGVARTVTLDTNTPSLGLASIDLTGAGRRRGRASLDLAGASWELRGGLRPRFSPLPPIVRKIRGGVS